jgi:predicted transglutaminase-like cysteine proteinase
MMRLLRCGCALGLLALMSQGCASVSSPRSFEFFVEATPENQPWFGKIQDWRERNNADPNSSVGLAPQVLSGELAELNPPPPLWPQINQFSREHQLELARSISAWSQHWAFRHYKKDVDESVDNDHWPTFSELLEKDGDDCDGLSLLNYEMLLLFGFNRDEVYRALVRRDSDGVNHMVVLWFKSETDPWVIDITRAASPTMEPISKMRGWQPVAMFNRDGLYNIIEIKPDTKPKAKAIVHHD